MGHILNENVFWFERKKHFYAELNHIYLFQMLDAMLDNSLHHKAKRSFQGPNNLCLYYRSS